MNALWSESVVKVGHWQAMHLHVDRVQLRNTAPMVSFTFDDAQTANGTLIFYGHDVTSQPSPYGCSPALLDHALEAAACRKILALTMAEAMRCARA
jgi:hypothetical protein